MRGNMSTKPKPKPPPTLKRPRAQVMADVCAVLAVGESLEEACRRVGDAPHPSTVLTWTEDDPDGLGQEYARARARGYALLGDRIDRIAGETHAYTLVPELDPDGNPTYDAAGEPRTRRVLVPLSADVIASKRLQVDALKWKLSKMLPKVYGDRVTQEHTGAGGGPIAVAAVDLKGLTDTELEQMQRLLQRAAPKNS
jgi:hypothetical protein